VTANPTFSLSIAIVCYNSNHQELRLLVRSLLGAISKLEKIGFLQSIPVYLIDNSEKKDLELSLFDDSSDQIEKLGIRLCLINDHGNIGYGRAHNLVLDRLASDFHLILNPDVELDEQCLAEGLHYLSNNKNAAMVSPKASYQNGSIQYLCKRYPTVLTLFIRGFIPNGWRQGFYNRLAYYEMHDLYTNSSNDIPRSNIPIISGCFMLCRTAALSAISGFDERYFLYFEDFDLSLRMAEQGDIAFVPRMKITHGGGNTSRKGLRHICIFVRSGIQFFNNHGWQWLQHTSKSKLKM
jgi:GT2 family glycosyltransferase